MVSYMIEHTDTHTKTAHFVPFVGGVNSVLRAAFFLLIYTIRPLISGDVYLPSEVNVSVESKIPN